MKKLIIILLVIALLLPVLLALSWLSGYDVYANASYAEGEYNDMDVYIPKRADKRESNGVLLFIHGGSWSGGDKAEETFRCRMFASRGYVTASINYTLWSEETADTYEVFTVLDEIDAALSAITALALENGVKIDKAAVLGYSAGAHLALLYSYSRSGAAPLEISFASSMAGPADISARVWGRDMAKRVGKRLTGVEITDEMLDSKEADVLLATVSPVSYIDSDSPPTLIMHGGKDDVVPVGNSESLIEKLRQNSVPYDYVYLESSNHLLIQNPLGHVTYTRLLFGYCRTYFGY